MLISVIVPVYNAEAWLPRCIASILGQTHPELELILVDDGSADGSGAICDQAAARDPRVRVIHKANGGVSAARNDGIAAARGSWIAFCDNDDFYAPGMLARLLEICELNDCDIASCGVVRGSAERLETPPPAPPDAIKIRTGRQALENFYADGGSPWIWNRLYRREVWRDARFPVGSHMYEDNIVIHRVLGAARRVASTPEKLYYYFSNPASVTGRRFNVSWTSIDPYADRLEYARAESLPRLYAGTLVVRLYNEALWIVMNRRYNVDGVSRRKFHGEHSRLLRRYWREAITAPGISLRHRVLMTAARFTPPLYHLYNWLKWRVLRGQRGVRFGEIK